MSEDRMEGSRQTTELVSQLVCNVSALIQAMNNNWTPQARGPHVNVKEEVRNLFRPSNSRSGAAAGFQVPGPSSSCSGQSEERDMPPTDEDRPQFTFRNNFATRETILVIVSSHKEGKGILQPKQGNHLDHSEETLFRYLAQKTTSYPDKG
eukprot:gene11603-12797_t